MTGKKQIPTSGLTFKQSIDQPAGEKKTMTKTTKFDLVQQFDIVRARQFARQMAREMGFGLTDQTRIATAVSEVGRRAIDHQGQVVFKKVLSGLRRGLECTCLGDEYLQTLPDPADRKVWDNVKRLMDEFVVTSRGDHAVAVVMRKWLRATG